jgi:hypothetical protein
MNLEASLPITNLPTNLAVVFACPLAHEEFI